MRRNKKEMECMKNLVNIYLIDNQNDPYKAYNAYIKWHLLNNVELPSYIKGLKDFVKLSNEKMPLYEHGEKLEEKIKLEEESKKSIKEEVLKISIEQAKNAWCKVKQSGTDKEKITISDLYYHVSNGMIDTWDYNYNDIHILKKLNII